MQIQRQLFVIDVLPRLTTEADVDRTRVEATPAHGYLRGLLPYTTYPHSLATYAADTTITFPELEALETVFNKTAAKKEPDGSPVMYRVPYKAKFDPACCFPRKSILIDRPEKNVHISIPVLHSPLFKEIVSEADDIDRRIPHYWRTMGPWGWHSAASRTTLHLQQRELLARPHSQRRTSTASVLAIWCLYVG